MSGKFMSVKRYIIPTITMVIIASQLMGCAAMTSNELLDAINRGDQIEIEVAVPINQEDGTEISVDWTQLDQLTSQPELRKSMDNIFKIIAQDDSKNGVFYVNLEGKQEGNNTLYNVFSNSIFRNNYWNNEDIQEEVAKAAAEGYADVEFEEGHYDKAVLAAINAYFNILNDSEVGYANMDSTISRIEAMAAIFKAEYPVSDTLSMDAEFNSAIGVDSSNEYAIFASNLSEQSYLSISSGSLDAHTYKGAITRGELAYMLVQKYFADEYNAADTKATCYSDVKNGGDIATAEKFIENGNQKEGWQAYELVHALRNVDQGCPERMYKALVVAHNKGIITTTDCRWDEAVTKADFLEMLTNTYGALPVAVSAERGTISGYEVTDQETTEQDSDVNSTSDNVELGDDEYKGDDPNDLANKSDSDDDKSLVDKALEVEDPDADSGLTVGPDGYATDGLGVDLDGDGVITNFEKSFWEGVMGRTPSYPTGDGNTGGSSTTTPDGGSYVPGPTGQQGGMETHEDQTDSNSDFQWGQGDYTGLEGGEVY